MAEGRKEANFSQGWGVAAFITALAIGAFISAGVIKSNIYRSPRDPSAPNQARENAHESPANEGGIAH